LYYIKRTQLVTVGFQEAAVV